MKEPGLDNRHRDKAKAKAGEIQQKRGIVHEIIESGLGGPGGRCWQTSGWQRQPRSLNRNAWKLTIRCAWRDL